MGNDNPNGDTAMLSLDKLLVESPEGALGYAKAYVDMGASVVPNDGKKPTLKGWPERRLTAAELPLHFGAARNVGLLNGGPSGGLVTVDIDVPEAVKISDCFLPKTARSGREGTPDAHAWYRALGMKTKKWQDVDGRVLLEIRSDGCQTLVPPSVHPNGERYRWDREGASNPAETTAEELEECCAVLATATVMARHMPPVGGRHEYAKAVAGYLLRHLDEQTVRRITRAAWQAVGADAEDAMRDLEGIARDTKRRLEEGENAFGAPKLEEMAPGLPKVIAGWLGRVREDGGGGIVGLGADGPPTHDELRDGFSEANPDRAFGLGGWWRYENGLYMPQPEFLVKQRIMDVLVGAKAAGVRPTSGLLSSVHELARVDLAVEDERWDADPDILVCRNGALHVPTGELLPHSPDHFATAALPFDYDPDAEAPTWERVLREVLGKEVARFFQEFSGYAATPDTSLETALWFYGQPGGGRSTLLGGLETMLGPRAGVLGLGELERSRFALAEVLGRFLLTATEQPTGYMKISHLLNALISGEPLQAERKFRDPFTLVPRCKIAWAMNEVPRLKSASDGLFRRVKLIELDPIPEGERDSEVKKEIRKEGAGILNWALVGLGRLRERGRFEVPGAVREATEGFRLANDVPKMFVEDVCTVSDAEDCEEQAQKLYDSYKLWCQDNGHKPMSSTAVAKEWVRLGFRRRTLHGRAIWRGVEVDQGWVAARESHPRGW